MFQQHWLGEALDRPLQINKIPLITNNKLRAPFRAKEETSILLRLSKLHQVVKERP
jgi:hypothetical protein